jgi:hypothetical protein
MGPIEAELRSAPYDNRSIREWAWSVARGDLVFDSIIAACIQLGFSPDPLGFTYSAESANALPDVLSEAIEAAEALGL